MADIRVRVGVSVDANAKTVFVPIQDAAEKARKSIENSFSMGSKASWEAIAKAEKQKVAAVEQGASKQVSAVEKAEREKERAYQRLEKEAERMQRKMTADEERESNKRIAQAAKEEKAKSKRRLGRISFGPGASFAVPAPLAMGVGLGREFGRGLGMDFSMGNLMGKGMANEQAALQTVMAAPGQHMAPLAESRDLLEEMHGVAQQTATSTEDLFAGLRKFVGLTGDLSTGRDIIKQISVLSKITGTDMEETAQEAGEIANHLGNIPNKAQVVRNIMAQIAGQGKLGAVEMKTLAAQMAKIASMAGRIEGGAAQNMAVLGAMAQEAKIGGGATSAATSATSVARFFSEMQKSSTLKNWANIAHANPFTDKNHVLLRSPIEIIKQALVSTSSKEGADTSKLSKLFPSEFGQRAMMGFAKIFNESMLAHHDLQKALQAVNEEFDRFQKAQLDSTEIQREFEATMQTTKSKADLLQIQFQNVVDELIVGLGPAFDELIPAIKTAADALASFITGKTPQEAELEKRNREEDTRRHALGKEVQDIKNTKVIRTSGLPDYATNEVVSPGTMIDRTHVRAVQRDYMSNQTDLQYAEYKERLFNEYIHGKTPVKDRDKVKQNLEDMGVSTSFGSQQEADQTQKNIHNEVITMRQRTEETNEILQNLYDLQKHGLTFRPAPGGPPDPLTKPGGNREGPNMSVDPNESK